MAAGCHCWSVPGTAALSPSFVSKHLFPDFIFGGVQSRFIENPSVPFMKWFSESGLLEMNGCPQPAPPSTPGTNGTCLGSSGPYISRIFVNNCILFLVPRYNTLFHPSFSSVSSLLASVTFVARGFLACQCWPLLCSVHRLNQTRSAGRGETFPAPGTALCPEISSPLTLNWLGQCSELSSAPQAAG